MARRYDAEWAAVEAAESSGDAVVAAAEAECALCAVPDPDADDGCRPERAEILDAAKACVCGDRDRQYGSPEDNFALIGRFWSDYLGVDVTARNVAEMMCLFKIARCMTGVGTRDSYVDLCGYAACAGEIAGKNGA